MSEDDLDPNKLLSSGDQGSVGPADQSQSAQPTPLDTPLSAMTLGDLVTALQNMQANPVAESSSRSPAGMSLEAGNAEALRKSTARRNVTKLVGSSPPEIQMQYLKALAQDEESRSKFLQDPVGYSKGHGVLLDEDVVSTVLDTIVFDRVIDSSVVARLGKSGALTLSELRSAGGVNAWPAAVAAIAAVVAAGAAVVSAVTSVMSDNAQDILRLKGLGPNGIRMPGGHVSHPPGGAALVVSNPPGALIVSNPPGAVMLSATAQGGFR